LHAIIMAYIFPEGASYRITFFKSAHISLQIFRKIYHRGNIFIFIYMKVCSALVKDPFPAV